MLQDLIQQILVTVGSATVLMLAAVAFGYLPRLIKTMAKVPQAHRFKIDHGAVRVDIAITIGGESRGRKPVSAGDGG